jgi:branched-chain amino acid transport system ATP-binding protein
LYRPDEGDVVFEGKSLLRTPPYRIVGRGIARTFQNVEIFPTMTVLENVLVGATYGGGQPERAAYPACLAALAHSGLAAKVNARAGSLTLLERKRLELARALATGPRVLLLDEIAGGLTEPEVLALVAVIRDVRARGVAIIWIEHIVHALRSTVDRLVAIDFGRSLMDGPPEAVMASPEVQRVYLGIDTP